ncbi:uncharacterized protein BO80DRAFT_178156 [Aspergillus ibericus CBS 121593]|uniref:Uncharacterized protein n=1 Tax=Aspergillus ibericus CBS 121593 TaxID=1448316 RepID=A0A395HBB8_9EURO|nr:hypothetical protein BO80DRAFT_178156 [Aspergillus ibericus CBS 121593]RAL05142.1 hypothetical protein BO80DRAFT_178156 [Aspergillus ibericus CBS 121593]
MRWYLHSSNRLRSITACDRKAEPATAQAQQATWWGRREDIYSAGVDEGMSQKRIKKQKQKVKPPILRAINDERSNQSVRMVGGESRGRVDEGVLGSSWRQSPIRATNPRTGVKVILSHSCATTDNAATNGTPRRCRMDTPDPHRAAVVGQSPTGGLSSLRWTSV